MRELFSHRLSGNLEVLRGSTSADRGRLGIAFSISNCRLGLSICNLRRCFDAYRSALRDYSDSSQLPPIRCDFVGLARNGGADRTARLQTFYTFIK